MVRHALNLSIGEAEAGRSVCSRPAWSTKLKGHLGSVTEKPFHKRRGKEGGKKRDKEEERQRECISRYRTYNLQ